MKRLQEFERKESVTYGRTYGRTDVRTEGQTDVKSEIVIKIELESLVYDTIK